MPDVTKFETLDDFLAEEGIAEEVTARAKERIEKLTREHLGDKPERTDARSAGLSRGEAND